MEYKNKYLKYKNKYLELQKQIGGIKEEDVPKTYQQIINKTHEIYKDYLKTVNFKDKDIEIIIQKITTDFNKIIKEEDSNRTLNLVNKIRYLYYLNIILNNSLILINDDKTITEFIEIVKKNYTDKNHIYIVSENKIRISVYV